MVAENLAEHARGPTLSLTRLSKNPGSRDSGRVRGFLLRRSSSLYCRGAMHFCPWLGLAPKNDISGGKVLKSRTIKNRNRAAQAFRMAAQSASRSHGALGAFYRRMKGRLGP